MTASMTASMYVQGKQESNNSMHSSYDLRIRLDGSGIGPVIFVQTEPRYTAGRSSCRAGLNTGYVSIVGLQQSCRRGCVSGPALYASQSASSARMVCDAVNRGAGLTG